MHTDTDIGAERDRDRVALEQLRAEQQTVLEAIRQAEAKATSLLGLFAATLAAALVLVTRAERISPFAAVVLSVATAPLLGSVLALLSVLYARLRVGHGFIRWAVHRDQPAALIDLLTLPARHQVETQARRLGDLSALALTKFRHTNRAILLLLLGLSLLSLAVLTARWGA